mgnify:CR=1 FL=1
MAGPRTRRSYNQEQDKCNHQHNLVVNLSSTELTGDEMALLNKGLGFVPTSPLDTFTIRAELAEFFRKIRLKAFFEGKEVLDTNTGYTTLNNKS